MFSYWSGIFHENIDHSPLPLQQIPSGKCSTGAGLSLSSPKIPVLPYFSSILLVNRRTPAFRKYERRPKNFSVVMAMMSLPLPASAEDRREQNEATCANENSN